MGRTHVIWRRAKPDGTFTYHPGVSRPKQLGGCDDLALLLRVSNVLADLWVFDSDHLEPQADFVPEGQRAFKPAP
jgi:hypothetical protein